MKVEDRDNGYDDLVRRIDSIKRFSVLVGVFEKEGAEPHGDDVLTVLEIATIHEFGTDTIPERSWLRAWFDENIDRAREALRRLMVRIVEGQLTPEQALEQFGLWLVGQIQARISQGIEPELAQSTIDRKGSSVPLIDKGQFRSSITHKVEKG